MASFGSSFIQISKFWTTLTPVLSSKSLALQYDETPDIYELFALDGPIAYIATIYKGTVPEGVQISYSQVQNDADKADFEANYKASANRSVSDSVASIVDGYVTTVGTANTAIMASTYTEQASNSQRSLVSSDATDTSAGTGARTVRITYLNATMAGPFTETVTLNGTTPVNTVATDICFIEKMEVLTAGSNGGNAGTITLKAAAAGGGATIGTIVLGDNETNWCHHYVPIGKVAKISQIIGNIKGPFNGFIRLRKFTPTVANSVDYVIAPALRVRAGAQDQINFAIEIPVIGPARLALYAQSDGSVGIQNWVAGFNFHES